MNYANPYDIPRWLRYASVAIALSIVAMLLLVVAASTPKPPHVASTVAQKPTTNVVRKAKPGSLGNPPGVVDRLVMLDTTDAFAAGTAQRARLVSSTAPARVVLDDPREKSFPREGSWTSDAIRADFPFTELVPSWNVNVPADCGVAFDVRTRDAASGEWLPWIPIGSWGRVFSVNRAADVPGVVIDVDNIRLDHPADAFQIKAKLVSYSLVAANVPSVRRVAAVYSGVVNRAAPHDETATAPRDQRAGGGAIDLPVPFRTQRDAPAPLAGQICSPTSVSMVLNYFGLDRPTVENALAIYDGDNDMFGNWGRAVQFAGSLGFDAWLARFRNWDQVRAELARGSPIIASIRFKKGEFPSSVLSQTAGHLIVIRGMTADGNLIVNDPANRERGNGAVYVASELAHAWFDHGGVGYVIRGRVAAAGTQPASRPTTAPSP